MTCGFAQIKVKSGQTHKTNTIVDDNDNYSCVQSDIQKVLFESKRRKMQICKLELAHDFGGNW